MIQKEFSIDIEALFLLGKDVGGSLQKLEK